MKNISLKLDEYLLDDTDEIVDSLNTPRNRYINEAIAHYNVINKRALIKKQLEIESHVVRANSMDVLKDFEDLEDDLP